MSDIIERDNLPAVMTLSEKAQAVICTGDLKGLNETERVIWYRQRCDAAGLDWRTEPFQYIILNGKLKLYATKTATEQIAQNKGITLQIIAREDVRDCYVVTCRATGKDGRFTESLGAVPIGNMNGELLCNALMKGETKSKRRAVLSLTGLSMMDESEVESIQGATVHPVDVVHSSTFTDAQEQSSANRTAPQQTNAVSNAPTGNTLAGTVNTGEQCKSCHAPTNAKHAKNCTGVSAQQSQVVAETDDGEHIPTPATAPTVYAETPKTAKDWADKISERATGLGWTGTAITAFLEAIWPNHKGKWVSSELQAISAYADAKFIQAIESLQPISAHGNESAESIKTRPITRQQKTFAAWQGSAPDPDAVGKLEEIIRADTTGNSMQECFNNLTLAQCDLVDSYIASIGPVDSQFDKAVAGNA